MNGEGLALSGVAHLDGQLVTDASDGGCNQPNRAVIASSLDCCEKSVAST
jgi:hypothetical protein